MTRRKTLTDNMIAKLKPGPKRVTIPDPQMAGHYIRVSPSGVKSFVAVARDPDRRQTWTTLGSADHLSVDEARAQAREVIRRVKAGQTAFEPPPEKPDSFEAVANNWLKRHVQAKKLRSEYEITRILRKHVYPIFGGREFEAIRRSDVAKLLDRVEDGSGPRTADTVLATLSGVMHWHAARSDDYVPPLARGMRRDDPHAKRRARILDDDEIRQLWAAADQSGPYGCLVKLAMLTAQRRTKLAEMRWDDVSVDGVWHVRAEPREKGCGGDLALPELAIQAIRSQMRVAGNPHIFPGRGAGHSNAHHINKRRIDDLAKIDAWVFHDLRRTARSLMSRARVSRNVAERVLGHVIQGVEGTYDRHSYHDEKAEALAKLAGLIERILAGPATENVVDLHREA